MQEIADWLEALGMSEYAQRFADERIDFSVLPDLTDRDLKDLGVVLGDRRKLLRAIAKLDCTPEIVTPIPKSLSTSVVSEQLVDSDGLIATLLLCNLVDPIGLAAKVAPEEWRDVVEAYLDAASMAVMDMGGMIAKKLDDGLLALFGYPAMQENDTERAVKAALATQRALTTLSRIHTDTCRLALAAQITIDSGPVVIDAAGEIFGAMPNIVAQAQSLAEPGAVVVTARVQRQVAGLFLAKERGSHQIKGIPEAVTLYRIVRSTGGGHRKPDYDRLLARTVKGIDMSSAEARLAAYERARNAMVAQLRFNQSAISKADIAKERLALEHAIRKVEAEVVRKSRTQLRWSRGQRPHQRAGTIAVHQLRVHLGGTGEIRPRPMHPGQTGRLENSPMPASNRSAGSLRRINKRRKDFETFTMSTHKRPTWRKVRLRSAKYMRKRRTICWLNRDPRSKRSAHSAALAR
jgi:class 3 adenylate cyclase